MFRMPIAEGRVEGKQFGADRVSRTRSKIEKGECFAPELPGFVWWMALIGKETDASSDTGALPGCERQRLTVWIADITEGDDPQIETTEIEKYKGSWGEVKYADVVHEMGVIVLCGDGGKRIEFDRGIAFREKGDD